MHEAIFIETQKVAICSLFTGCPCLFKRKEKNMQKKLIVIENWFQKTQIYNLVIINSNTFHLETFLEHKQWMKVFPLYDKLFDRTSESTVY